MNFQEKAIFLWDASAIDGGDPSWITMRLKTAGFEAVYLHWQTLDRWRAHFPPALLDALRAAGLVLYGSAAVYGDNPAGEGHQAAAIVNEFGLSGFIFDAESGWDAKPTPGSNAVTMLRAYKQMTAQPSAWCWWPHYQSSNGLVTYHDRTILRAAMMEADYGMPMAYWSWGDSPAQATNYLNVSWKQWRAVTSKPLVVAGRAFIGDGGTPTFEAVKAYEARARALGAAGVGWWSLQHAVVIPGCWQALSELSGFSGSQEVVPMWQDNAFGVVVDGAMNVDFAALAAQACNFVVIEAGSGLAPNPNLADQCSKAAAAGLPVLLQYTPYPAIVNVTFDQVPQVQLAELRKWIANKKFYGMIISVEHYDTLDSGTKASDTAINNTVKVLAETLDSELKPKGVKVLIRSNDAFTQSYAPSLSNWTDKFGYFLADWRFRTRDASGAWTVYNGFPTATTQSVADILAAFPAGEIKNPPVPGSAPQLKFWEYTSKYGLSCIKGWDGKAKVIKVARFNGPAADALAYLGYKSGTPDDEKPPVDNGDLQQRVAALEVQLAAVSAALHKPILA